MLAPVNYAQLLFPDFSLILIGYLVCRYTALNRAIWQPVESLVYYFLFPTLLFYSIIRSPIDWQGTSNLMLAGVATGLVAIAMTYTLPRWPWLGKRVDSRDAAASAQIAFRFNSFIGLALADRLAGPQGLQLISVLIGVCVPMFNIAAVYPMAKGSQNGFMRELLRNPLIVATLTALICNLLGLRLPAIVEPTVARIGQASIVLGLMSAGAGMQLGLLARGKLLSGAVLAIRHFVTPLIALCMAHWLALSAQQAAILLIFSALPTASTCYVLAARMGYNGAYVAGLVTLSTICGVASLPFALSLLGWWPV
ncbi:AEC family transporter [Comamonas sp. MYb396]|uniref:AEC family transporter n=1 Tax=Comamonas sp. MYb396 TaxID=2745302 RepID=UPI00309A1139